MSTITGRRSAVVAADTRESDVLDSIDLQDAVVGDGLLLTQDHHRRWVVHSLDGGAAPVGRFTSAAAALSCLDQLDDEYDV